MRPAAEDEAGQTGAGAVPRLGRVEGASAEQETLRQAPPGALGEGDAPDIPAHRLLRRIGEGSYGTIWLAVNAMGTYRAVKVVYRTHFSDVHPYEREYDGIKHFEPLSRSHDGFLDILQVERNDQAGYFYYVMELGDDVEDGQQIRPETYQAKTLAKEREQLGFLPLEECLRLAVHLSSALEHLHKHKLVHRDIKGANIIFVNGSPKLADIGLVSEIRADSTFVGTPGFIPPEGPGSPAADIYSLGKVLYAISTGLSHREFPTLPSKGSAGPETNTAAFGEWYTILLKACAENVALRYHSATELQAHLALVRAGKSVKRLLQVEHYFRLARRYGPIAAVLLVLLPLVAFQIARERRRAAADRQRQAGSYVAYGARAFADGELLNALPWFVRALRLDQGDAAKNLTDRVRIRAALEHSPKLIQVCFSKRGRNYAEFGLTDDQILSALPGERSALWSLSTGQPIGPMVGTGKYALEQSSFSSDLHRIVTYNADLYAHVWDASTGQQISQCGGHGWILSARFDPTGQRVVTVENEAAEPRVWDVATGQEVFKLPSHTNDLWFATYSPDGRWIAAGSRGGQAILWDATSGERLRVFSGHNYWVHYAAFSPDSRLLATAAGDHTVRLRDVESGRELLAPLQHNDHVFSVEFSPDGKWLLTACLDGTVHIWDVASGRHALPTLRHHARVVHAAFSRSGQRVLCVDMNGTICVWQLRAPSSASLGQGVAFSGDGRRQARWSDGALEITETADERRLASLAMPQGLAGPPSFDFAGNTLLVTRAVRDDLAHSRQEVQLWDLQQQARSTWHWTNPAGCSDAALSAQGTWLTARSLSQVSIWNLRSGDGPWVIPSREVQAIASDHVGSRLVLVRKNVLEVWSLLRQPPRLLWAFTNDMLIAHAEFSPDNRFLLAACWDASFKPGAAQLLSAQTGQAVVPPLAHRDGVLYATFSPGGERILTCSEDFSALLWETSTGRKLPVAPLLHGEQVIYGAFSQSGSWVLTVEKNGTVRVWDAFTAELVLPPLRHSQPITAAQFVRGDSRLATRGQDGTVQWWDLSPDTRSLEDLARVAALLTGQEGDLSEANSPRVDHEWKADWEHLASRFPQDFSPSLEDGTRK